MFEFECKQNRLIVSAYFVRLAKSNWLYSWLISLVSTMWRKIVCFFLPLDLFSSQWIPVQAKCGRVSVARLKVKMYEMNVRLSIMIINCYECESKVVWQALHKFYHNSRCQSGFRQTEEKTTLNNANSIILIIIRFLSKTNTKTTAFAAFSLSNHTFRRNIV